MKKSDLFNKLIFDYRNFFDIDELEEYKKEMASFLKENKEISDDEFFKKFDEKFYSTRFIDKVLSRIYLSRISADIKVIKVIVVIYFIASIIVGLYYGFAL